jgi:hypothetical protein
MEQDSCRRNWFFEESLNSSRHVGPPAAATISVGAVTTEKISIVSSSARGTYDWNHPGFLDRHENGCKWHGDEGDQRANQRRRQRRAGCIDARLGLAKLEPAFAAPQWFESPDALRRGLSKSKAPND